MDSTGRITSIGHSLASTVSRQAFGDCHEKCLPLRRAAQHPSLTNKVPPNPAKRMTQASRGTRIPHAAAPADSLEISFRAPPDSSAQTCPAALKTTFPHYGACVVHILCHLSLAFLHAQGLYSARRLAREEQYERIVMKSVSRSAASLSTHLWPTRNIYTLPPQLSGDAR